MTPRRRPRGRRRAHERSGALAPTWRPSGLWPLLVLCSAALWATMGLWAKAAYAHGVGPLEAASARGTAAFLVLSAWAVARPSRFAVGRSDVPVLAGFGVLGIGVFYAAYLSALRHLDVSVAAALLYTAPAFAVALGALLLREPLTRRKATALSGVLAGVLLVTGALGGGVGAVRPLGVGLGLLSGLTYAAYTLFGRASRARMDAVRALYWPTGIGAAFLALLAPPWRPLLDHPGALPAIAGMAVVATVLPNLLFLIALGRLEAGVASIFATLEPVMAALYGVLLLGESLDAEQTLGIAVIATSAGFLAISRAAPRPAAEAPTARETRR